MKQSSKVQSKVSKSKDVTAPKLAKVLKALVAAAAPVKERYEHYYAAAMALRPAEVRKFKARLSLVTINGARSADLILAHEEMVKADLHKISFDEIRSLDGRASALVYAHNLVLSYASPKTIKPKIERGRKLRAKLLRAADPLVEAGLLPAEAVARIRQGVGPVDAANDLLSLDALFRAHWAAIAQKTTISPDDLIEAGELGGELLAQIQTGGVKRTTDRQLAAAMDVRDRMWTLYETTWEQHVWRAGAWLFGRAVDDQMPVLQAHVGHKRTPAPAPAPAPAPTPAPTPAPAPSPTPTNGTATTGTAPSA